MTTRTWDTTIPADTGYAGDGDDEIRNLKVDLKERLEQDHYMDGELDPLEGDCEGYHRKATLYAQVTDPTPLTGTGVIYTKVIDGVTELFFRDATTGTINQLTENGVLSLNTLANDIDADGHGITGADILESDVVTAGTLNVTTIAKTGTGVVTNLNADLLDGKHAPSGALIGATDAQTLSNKTIDASCSVAPKAQLNSFMHNESVYFGDIFNALAPYIPDVGNVIKVSGIIAVKSTGVSYAASIAYRPSSTRIDIYGMRVNDSGNCSIFQLNQGQTSVASVSISW